MKVRGSLIVGKDLTLPNPNGTAPSKGLVAVSDANGKVKWSHLVILPLDVLFTYPDKGSLVIHTGKVYYSLVNRARGLDFENPYVWKELNKDGVDALTQNQLDAIYAANFPSTENPFLTLQALLESLSDIQLEGDVTGEARIENGKLVINTTYKDKESYQTIRKISGESIPSHTPIAIVSNKAYKLDSSVVSHQFAFVGFSINGTTTGEECVIQEYGEVSLTGWGLQENSHYLVGVSGSLILDNTSSSNFTKVVGYATSSDSLKIITDYTTINK